MPSTRSSCDGVRTFGSASRDAGAAIQPRCTSTCQGDSPRRSGVTTSYPGRPRRSLLSRSTVRSATNRPCAATRLCARAAASTGPAASSIGADFAACSSAMPSARFSSARRDCQLPSATNAAQASAAAASAPYLNRMRRGRREYPRSMRYLVIGMFVLIVASLGSALVFVYRDRSGSTRALKALALRVGLSIALFAFLMIGYYLGYFRDRL